MTYFVHPGTGITAAYGQSWIIPKSAQNKEAAWLFVQWLLTTEVQNECLPLGCLAIRSDVLGDPRWEDEGWENRQGKPSTSGWTRTASSTTCPTLRTGSCGRTSSSRS